MEDAMHSQCLIGSMHFVFPKKKLWIQYIIMCWLYSNIMSSSIWTKPKTAFNAIFRNYLYGKEKKLPKRQQPHTRRHNYYIWVFQFVSMIITIKWYDYGFSQYKSTVCIELEKSLGIFTTRQRWSTWNEDQYCREHNSNSNSNSNAVSVSNNSPFSFK